MVFRCHLVRRLRSGAFGRLRGTVVVGCFSLLAGAVAAQDLNRLQPAPVPAQVRPPPPAKTTAPGKLPAGFTVKPGAFPGEKVLIARLTGVAFYASRAAAQAGKPGPGLTVVGLPLLDTPDFRKVVGYFLQAPASRQSLERLASATRIYLSAVGYPFSVVYLPPQDITAGVVRYVVIVSRMEGRVEVDGAHYFAPALYRAAIRQRPGQPLDRVQLQADIDWLNRNPFRAVSATTEAGTKPGTTKVVLQVAERRPWRFFAGTNNTGTKTTKENRFSAGVNWGNAFGRGDLLTAQWNSSWDFRTLRSGSASGTIFLPWRDLLTFSGAYSVSNAVLPPPFKLKGHSWQVSADYQIPLSSRIKGYRPALDFGVDVKATDNNFAFAAIPISNDLTQVVQARASYSGTLAAAHSALSFDATLVAAPGDVTGRNKNVYFNLSRYDAKADYVYFRGNATYRHSLDGIAPDLAWSLRGELQLSNHNLIGSEQFQGGGAYAVRGYEEDAAYKDNGLLLSQELHLPPWPARLGRGHAAGWLQAFVFEDYARLWSTVKLPGEKPVNLHSLGLGFDYSLGRYVSVHAAYGWQLIDSIDNATGRHSRLSFSAQISY